MLEKTSAPKILSITGVITKKTGGSSWNRQHKKNELACILYINAIVVLKHIIEEEAMSQSS